MNKVKMSLFENSVSFFSESLEQAIKAEISASKWKFAVLIQIQAIETLLKERLRQEHFALVYTDVDKKKHTVSLKQSIDRLKNIASVRLSDDDHRVINLALTLRNDIVHFNFEYLPEQVKSQFVKLVGFYIEFAKKHLDIQIVDLLEPNVKNELFTLCDYITELEKRALSQIKFEDIPNIDIECCPVCTHNTFVLLDNNYNCYLCGHIEDLVECDFCDKSEFEHLIKEYDFGNMKGLENWKYLCGDCWDKLDQEYCYEDDYL